MRKAVAKLARSHALASLGACTGIALALRPAGAAEFSYKLGMDTFAADPRTVQALQAAARVRDQSGGRLEIGVYPNNTLGTDAAMFSQLRLGAIEMVIGANGVLASVVPAAGIFSLDFIFASRREAAAAVSGVLGDYVRRAIAAAGMQPLQRAMWDGGFKQIASNRSISAPDDMAGLKLGTTPDKLEIAVFKALGAAPTPSGGAVYYTSLQTHLIEGAEVSLVTLDASHLYEVTGYVAMTNHVWLGQSLLANPAAWERLPPKLREIVERNFNLALSAARDKIAADETAIADKLKTKNGMTITSVSFPAFAAVLQKAGIFAQWRQSFGSDVWDLLERAVGRKLAY